MGVIDKHARSGRTTRLIEEAVRLARAGRAVYVVMLDWSEAARMILAEEEANRLGIKFETPESLGNFDLETMRLRRSHPNCVVLVDHYVIERRFATMLEMLHRFDGPDGGTSAALTEALRRDATVHRIMAGGGTPSDCTLALVDEKKALTKRIEELESIAPKKIRMPDGSVAVWRCPDELVPIQQNQEGSR